MSRLPAVDASMASLLDEAVRQSGPAQTIDQILRAIRREWRVLFMVAMLVASLAATYLALVDRRYTAGAIIMAAPRQTDIATTDAVSRDAALRVPDVEGELQIMSSPAALARVVERLGLAERADRLASVAGDPEPLERVSRAVLGRLAPAALDLAAAARPDPLRDTHGRLVDQLTNAVQVTPVGRSNLARIRISATDASLATEVANAIADNYLDERVRGRQDAAGRAADWLQNRAQEMRGSVLDAERRAAEMRLSLQREGRDHTQIDAEMTGLNERILQARVEQERARRRLITAEDMVQRAGLLALLDLEESGGGDRYVDRLRSSLAEARQEAGRLGVDQGSQSLSLRAAQAQQRIAQGQLETEARTRLLRVQAESTAAASLAASLEERLLTLRAQANELGRQQVQLQALELEASANRAVYENFVGRWRTTQQVGFDDTNGWLVSPATIPAHPTWPKVPLVLAAAALAGLGLGASAVGFREFRQSRTLRNGDDVARHLGVVRQLGLVPRLRRRDGAAVRAVLSGAPHAFAEAIMGLQDRLALAAPAQGGRVLIVTSALPHEGKSTTVASLAAAAASGQRVALIDGDLRAPTQHAAFPGSTAPGVAAYVAGDVAVWRQAGHDDEASGVFVMPAGSWRGRPQDFARSPRLATMLQAMRKEFDLILIDTPPVLVASDTLTLSTLGDGVVLAVRWAATPTAAVREARLELLNAGVEVTGVVLTQVDLSRFATFDTPGAEPYRRRYRSAANSLRIAGGGRG
ncbi:Wzz/FepE/Etk N-terminal domain-containing protein [Pseudoroseomonas globiformis]|uniref:Wzz/FepE/Etk N-terminal domain-containing protein n=1 Tax=Teichococcus globiformis TaxID=2307229 RepID=A0ABV7FW89_9PROT